MQRLKFRLYLEVTVTKVCSWADGKKFSRIYSPFIGYTGLAYAINVNC